MEVEHQALWNPKIYLPRTEFDGHKKITNTLHEEWSGDGQKKNCKEFMLSS